MLISVEMAMNQSAGILSSSSTEIKRELQMNDKQYGMFGTANGLGRVIGCFLFTILVNNFNRKWTFVFFTVVKSLFLVLFKFTNIGWLLITCRGLIGLTHMPPSIYIPVWIDQFGLKNYKTSDKTSATINVTKNVTSDVTTEAPKRVNELDFEVLYLSKENPVYTREEIAQKVGKA